MPKILTLGSKKKRTQFNYTGSVSSGATLEFTGRPYIKPDFFRAILKQFQNKTILGGFSMTNPTLGGLGEWVQGNARQLNGTSLSPRHASFLAAILVNEGFITSSLKGNAVYLHFASPAE